MRDDISCILNMTVDVFGRQLNTSGAGPPGKPGIGFLITKDGHYNLECKRLCNAGEPKEAGDVVTLGALGIHLESLSSTISYSLNKKFESSTIALQNGVNANLINLRAEIDILKRAITNLNGDSRLLQDVKTNVK